MGFGENSVNWVRGKRWEWTGIKFNLPDSFDLLYFIHQRVSSSQYFKCFSEQTFLCFHLQHKLKKIKGLDDLPIDEYAEFIDVNYPKIRELHPNSLKVKFLNSQWLSERFNKIAKRLKEECCSIEYIYKLYDLAKTKESKFEDKMV